MIVLLFDGTGGGSFDLLQITVTSLDTGAGVQWYCTWVNTASPMAPYRNNGVQAAFAPAFTMNSPAPSLQPYIVQEVTEITIHNPGPSPVTIYIDIFNGGSTNTSRIFRCALGGEQTLSYNATPGANGSWNVYDNSAFLISSR